MRSAQLALAAACFAVGAVCIVWGVGGGTPSSELVGARGLPEQSKQLKTEASDIERRQQRSVERAAAVLVISLASVETLTAANFHSFSVRFFSTPSSHP